MISLVTGATGLFGNNLVRLLLARGDQVRVLVRAPSDPRPLADLDVERHPGDLTDPTTVEAAVSGVDRVFHAAAQVQVGRTGTDAMARVNVGGTRAVARACRKAGVRMLHVSSVDALGYGTREHPAHEQAPAGDDFRVPYLATKRAADRAVLEEVRSGLDAVIVHPVYLLGPWDWKPSSGRMLLAVASGRVLVAPPGGNDFGHVEDAAAGAVAAAERGGKGDRFVLGGEALTYREAFDLFARVTGGRRPVLTAPPFLVRAAGLLGDAWGVISGKEPDVNSGSATLSCLPHHFSDQKARSVLGYRPRSAEAAARDAWGWFLSHGYTARGPRRVPA